MVTLEITREELRPGRCYPERDIAPSSPRVVIKAAEVFEIDGDKIRDAHHHFDMTGPLQQIAGDALATASGQRRRLSRNNTSPAAASSRGSSTPAGAGSTRPTTSEPSSGSAPKNETVNVRQVSLTAIGDCDEDGNCPRVDRLERDHGRAPTEAVTRVSNGRNV